ncbi:MAG TPA: hypothetical protein DCG34_09635, partial [Clostridiales bacterium]|nr:hypothetical protein [Clostridiales bacterium]
MNAKLNKRRNIGRVLFSLLFAFLIFSFSDTKTIFASNSHRVLLSIEDVKRTDMIDIAELYSTYSWTAAETNILHHPYGENRFNASGQLLEADGTLKQVLNFATDALGTLDYELMTSSPVNTPEWILPGVENEGIPYAWGISSGIDALNIPIGAGNISFDEKIAGRHFAGNKYIDTQNANGWVAGVDCIGLVNNVWRMGNRFPMAITRSRFARPIKFKDLKPGDILMDEDEHVMVFDQFIDYDPVTDGEPPAGTRFFVYEAAGEPYWKVIYREHSISGAPRPIPFDNEDGFFRGAQQSPTESVSDWVTIDGLDYVPGTYLNQTSVAIVIDVSGPFDEGGWIDHVSKEKEYAKKIVDFLNPGDKVGVVIYSTYHVDVLPLTVITDDNKEFIKSIIDSDVRYHNGSGDGDLHLGLQKGMEVLSRAQDGVDGWQDPVRIMILMSKYAIPHVSVDESFLNHISSQRVQIHTLGTSYSWGFWHKLMWTIAKKTGGTYSRSFDELLENLWIESVRGDYSVKRVAGVIPADTSNVTETVILNSTNVTETVIVDSTMGSITASLFWTGDKVEFSLEGPTDVPGETRTVDELLAAVDPNITFISDETTYASYTVLAPYPGEWTLNISGDSEQEYQALVSTMDAMLLSVETDKQKYVSGEQVKLVASIQDSVSPAGTTLEYIYDASIEVTVEIPKTSSNVDSEIFTFNLFDNGENGDDDANDGIYSGIFDNSQIDGFYTFNLEVEGVNNRDGGYFTREKKLFIEVNSHPRVESIVRLSENPTNLGYVEYAVTFSEPVEGVDISDFTLTTSDGISDAAVYKVQYSSNGYYIVTVNTGNGSGALRLDVADNDSISDGVNIPGSLFLGGPGLGNGDFIDGEIYDIDGADRSNVVNKTADTDDGFCSIDDCSLREALDTVGYGATITLSPTLYGETIPLNSTLTLTRPVTIDGSLLTEPIIISGQNTVQVFSIAAAVTLNGLTITDGRWESTERGGGGIFNGGSLTIIDSTLSNNSAWNGGGIYNG